MKAVVDKTSLSRALQVTGKAVALNPVIPLLGSILLESANGHSRVAATNMEIGISCGFPSKGKKFSVCVPAKMFGTLIDALYSDEVTVTLEEADQSITVETETSSTVIKCLPADDFPPMPVVEEADIVMPVVQFKEMVNRVAFCANTKDNQSNLAGVMLTVEKGQGKKSKNKFIMFATNGYRIAVEQTEQVGKVTKADLQAVIRSDNLEMVSKTLPSEGELEIQIGDKHAMFHCGEVDVVAQLLGGNFPDYHMVTASIPKPTTTVTLPALELLRACKQLKVFASETSKTVMEIEGFLVRYSISTTGRGGSKAEIVGMFKGENVTFGIDVHYLYALLEVCKSPKVIIELAGAKNVLKFTMEGLDGYIHLIMPIIV